MTDEPEDGAESVPLRDRPSGEVFNLVQRQIDAKRAQRKGRPPVIPERFRVLRPHEFPAFTTPKLITGIAHEDDLIMLYGASAAGKSFCAVDLALSIAAGVTWQGRATLPGSVVYVAAEARASIQRRVAAWLVLNDLITANPPFGVMGVAPDLLNADGDTTLVIETCRAFAKATGQPMRLLVLDTMHACTRGSKEDSEDTGRFADNMQRLHDELGCAVLVVHHSGKDAGKGARGSSSLEAAFELVIEVAQAKEDEHRNVIIRKQRDDRYPDLSPFDIQSVVIGRDASDGAIVRAGVAVLKAGVALAADDATAQKMTAIEAMIAQGSSHGDVAKSYGVNRATIYRWLKAWRER